MRRKFLFEHKLIHRLFLVFEFKANGISEFITIPYLYPLIETGLWDIETFQKEFVEMTHIEPQP